MTVAELRRYLSDKKSNAIVEVIVNNKSFNFTMCLGGGKDCEIFCDDSYDNVSFYVDELCQSENISN